MLPENTKRVRGVLGRFLFTGDRVFQEIGTLSGGEKTRLALAKMALDGPNLLVLDEPTTHLDVLSRSIIGEAQGSYNGTIIAVTHDVTFVREKQRGFDKKRGKRAAVGRTQIRESALFLVGVRLSPMEQIGCQYYSTI
jgi:ATPase subunit of ABC transporter with duplicated ATPase domains